MTAKTVLVDELNYIDNDHSLAHGLVPKNDSDSLVTNVSVLTRNRSQTRLASDQNRGRTIVDPNISKRKRRTSHDEKLLNPRKFLIDVEETKRLILQQEDTDGDLQITIHDKGPKQFNLGSASSGGYRKYDIRGTYMLSNLLQELALASDYGRRFIVLDEERLNENPTERLSRLIKYHFWDGLTRRIDAEGLELICNDPKNRQVDQQSRVYIPYHDKFAFDYYTSVAESRPHLNIQVVRLPEIITPEYVKSINTHPGILSLMLKFESAEDSKPKKKKSGRKSPIPKSEPIIRGVPFVVPGGRFNEMYGWDSFFECLGLLVDGRIELARGMVDNFAYQIEHYNKILNANRSYYLTRSQPPFLTEMTLECWRSINSNPSKLSKSEKKIWLHQSFRASIRELLSIWLASPRLDEETGLVKFRPEGIGMPPETESTHFNHVVEPYAKKLGVDVETFIEMYTTDKIKVEELDRYFVHDRAVRESGHDTTYRFEKKCASLVTIDLNSLVFKYEVDIARVIGEEFGGSFILRCRKGPDNMFLTQFEEWLRELKKLGVNKMLGRGGPWNSIWAKGIMVFDEAVNREIGSEFPEYFPPEYTPETDVLNILEGLNYPFESPEIDPDMPTYKLSENADCPYFCIRLPSSLFISLANRTKQLVNKHLWNPQARMYFDYNVETEMQSVYETVTTFYALWSGLANEEQASVMVPRALSLFEVQGGLVCGTEESRGRVGLERPNRQWDYPYGWAPHQILAWQGLSRYGYTNDAKRVCYRWLYTISKSFVDFNGVVPEKFDVVGMTHKVNVEYGNVGADFKLVVREGFGWMNASFQVGLTYMNKTLLRALGTLTPPDKLFSVSGGIIQQDENPNWSNYNYGYGSSPHSRQNSSSPGPRRRGSKGRRRRSQSGTRRRSQSGTRRRSLSASRRIDRQKSFERVDKDGEVDEVERVVVETQVEKNEEFEDVPAQDKVDETLNPEDLESSEPTITEGVGETESRMNFGKWVSGFVMGRRGGVRRLSYIPGTSVTVSKVGNSPAGENVGYSQRFGLLGLRYASGVKDDKSSQKGKE
ncbi:alpha,alpha-trehalase nth1 [Nowakowskiella sp. JEL0407]|nr:alpha,alpha-trehalase nth1 [Nowakowskiella sp. JEL0407]